MKDLFILPRFEPRDRRGTVVFACYVDLVNQPVLIKPVVSRSDKKAFIEFPYRLYRDDRNWVPPLRFEQRETLDPSRNPFFEHAEMCCFLAISGSDVCERIAAIIDRDANAALNRAIGTFGFSNRFIPRQSPMRCSKRLRFGYRPGR